MSVASTQRLRDMLPTVYSDLLSTWGQITVPKEEQSACHSCPMTERDGTHALQGKRCFAKSTKCCTYFPKLPNYLVGAILSDETLTSGRSRILDRIRLGHGVSPWGIGPDGQYQVLSKASKDAFGRATALLCPYFDQSSGGCTIWSHRESVCSTFFCKHDDGAKGHQFWMSLKKSLILVEQRLADFCLIRLSPEALRHGTSKLDPSPLLPQLTAEELDGLPMPEVERQKIFGDWAGREEEFFRRCFELIASKQQNDLEEIIGDEGTKRWQAVLAGRATLAKQDHPKRLRLAEKHRVLKHGDGRFLVVGYNSYNPMVVDAEELRFLRGFGGGDDSRALSTREMALVASAYRYGVLVSSSAPPSA